MKIYRTKFLPRLGKSVLAVDNGHDIYAVTYANLTQANTSAEKWAAKGLATSVIGNRPYFVVIDNVQSGAVL